ncbi:RagB/SusD family nutrient uptake outer membrane protein [Marinilabiliaceae bacterium JC017]|nr:RagB/SusD family nutrient uptake outer membrane protein [Marinilabiliaceae bacterium JC017]
MKNMMKYILSLTAIATGLCSCEDYLDTLPDNRTTLDSPEAVSELLVSAYPDAAYYQFTEVMSDNVSEKGKGDYVQTQLENTEAYFWKDHTTQADGTPIYYWNACYSAIAHANHALEAIESVTNPEDYAAQKGEALVARAYAHFMLVNLFAKPYDPVTADSDLGVPYVTESEKTVFKNYKRETVGTIYKKLEADIVEGIKLIKDEVYTVPKYHFTKTSANAFAARFYLFMGNWDKVIEHANIALGTDPVKMLRDWNGSYLNLTYDELKARYNSSEEPANLLLASAEAIWQQGYIVYRYSLYSDIKDELFPTFGSPFEFSYRVAGYETMYHVPKFNQYKKRLGGVNANMYIGMLMAPLFTAEEVLLNRAEAYAMKKDNTKAFADLEVFRSKRVKKYDSPIITEQYLKDIYESEECKNNNFPLYPFYTVEDEQLDVIRYILDLRRREFVHEGIRWFDIRRFHMQVVHKTQEGEEFVLPADDLRKVLQIPSQAIASGLTPNPR